MRFDYNYYNRHVVSASSRNISKMLDGWYIVYVDYIVIDYMSYIVLPLVKSIKQIYDLDS